MLLQTLGLGYSIQDQIVESSIPDGTVNNLGGYDNFLKIILPSSFHKMLNSLMEIKSDILPIIN